MSICSASRKLRILKQYSIVRNISDFLYMKAVMLRMVRFFLGAAAEMLYVSLLVFLGISIGLFSLYVTNADDISDLLQRPLSETSVLLDRTGTTPLYELHGEENRTVISHDAIPDTVRLATIAAEDNSFYSHHGVDIPSIIRAAVANVRAGDIEQGASTITQQLARIAFLSREKTFSRKIREAILAIKIERVFSKEDILDLYLNTVPYGSNAYGIERAAQTFFGKSARDLSLDEAALLSALPRATAHYSPYGSHREELRSRQRHILETMERLGFISEYEARRAIDTNTFAYIVPLSAPIHAPHFVFAVLDELERRYGMDFLETRGLRIRTTLDLGMQENAEAAVEKGVIRNASRRAENAALVSVDVATGDVLAMVGSRNYFDTAIDGKVNVTLRPRQPGSAFKPFVYALAFERGYEPETLLYDVPTNFGPDGSGRDYVPKDYDGRYRGALPMKEALPQSLNIPAVQTLSVVGVSDAISFARRLGITTLSDSRPYGLALVLGGAEVLSLDMASAFASFASEGIRRTPRFILSVDESHGEVHDVFPIEESTVLSTEVARRINTVLSDNSLRAPIFGANSPLAFPKGEVAAKTGTTQYFNDAWTVGYTPSLSVAVWAGNNDNSPMAYGSDGVFVAAPIWRDFLNHVLPRYPQQTFAPYQMKKSDEAILADRFGKHADEYAKDGKKKDKKEKEKKKKK